MRPPDTLCKRTLDILLAITGLIVGAPLMLVIALLVWLDSPGKVIFSQARLGRGGRTFRVHKFRKFPINWDDDAGSGVTVRGDARMTGIGRILERTKLDELPQLWNILKGEMSFVGPRPEILRYGDLFVGPYRKVLDYTPGIFGPSQIANRNEADMYPADESPDAYYRRVIFPAKAQNDIAYFGEAHCLKDIQWIVKGLWVSVVGAIPWRRIVRQYVKIVLIDALMIAVGWLFAYGLRYYDFVITPYGLGHILHIGNVFRWGVADKGLMIFPGVVIAAMLIGGCYRAPARYFSLEDSVRLLIVAGGGWMIGFLILIGLADRGISILLFPLGGAGVLGLLLLPRLLARLSARRSDLVRPHGDHPHQRRVLIYGANVAGTALARWLGSGIKGMHLIGFVDDNPKLAGGRLVNSQVLGRESDIPTLQQVYGVTELWVTFSPDRIKRHLLNTASAELGMTIYILSDMKPFAPAPSAE